MKFTVAIDGPAAAGKGTISRAVAAHYGFAHLDTGLLYRAVGRRTLDGTPAIEAARALRAEDLEADDLRTPAVAQAASKVAVKTSTLLPIWTARPLTIHSPGVPSQVQEAVQAQSRQS